MLWSVVSTAAKEASKKQGNVMTTALVKFDQAYRALQEARTIDEIKEVRDKAEALRLYVKQQGDSLEMQNTCAEIKLRAERRAGELLAEMPKNSGGGDRKSENYKNHSFHNDRGDNEPTLSDIGIDYNQSHRWQQIAKLPEETFEQEIAETKAGNRELTSSRMLKIARRHIAKETKTEPPPLTGKYRILYADPPWKYNDSGLDDYGHAERHYPPMTIQELCDLGKKVRDITEDNAVLFFWVTSPLLEVSFRVINAWGFQYKTSFVWDKVLHNHGHYNSVRHELLLVCTRGNCTPDVYKLFDSVQSIERSREHSEKPEQFREIIDTIYPNGERIELFARRDINGWQTWGNETVR